MSSVTRAAPVVLEPLESRQLLSAVVWADQGRLIFNDVVGGSVTAARSVTLRNNGDTNLTISSATISGTAATKFRVVSRPTTILPGQSGKVSVNFGATYLGPQGATLQIRSNASNNALLNVTLRGLGTRGLEGSNEPSLQWILDTYQIPVKVGDTTPSEGTLNSPPATPNNELVRQLFQKAGPGVVTVTPIAIFSGPASPAAGVGYYTLTSTGGVAARNKLFDVPSADYQTLNPRVVGRTTFDPGTQKFGLFSQWAAQNNRVVYQQDFRNTFITSSQRRMFRFYPLKNPDGSTVPNAYVVGNEEAFNHDYQDGVYIIRNVRAA
jgi:hypothetical protein